MPMRRLFASLVMVVGLVAAGPSYAVLPDEVLDDPALEARARALSAELRCLVCQSQSIDDSAAALARDLRLLVRERLVEGDSDQQVLDYLVDRYGDFVLLKPRFTAQTALLWAVPALAFLVAAGVAVAQFCRRPGPGGEGLSAAEEEEIRRLMADDA